MATKISAEEFLTRLADRNEENELTEVQGKIKNIMRLFVAGYTRKEIVACGFNRSTVYRQTGEYMKLKKAPAVEFHGYPLYEARIQKLCKAKGLSRDAAIDVITEKDLDAIDEELEQEYGMQAEEEETDEE